LLLDVHREVVVRIQDVVDHLEVERGVAKGREVGAVESRLIDPLDNLLHEARDLLERRDRCRVEHAEAKDHSTLCHPLEIADPTVEQVG